MPKAITNAVKPSGFGCPIPSGVLLYVGRLVIQVDSLWLKQGWGKGLISEHQLMAPLSWPGSRTLLAGHAEPIHLPFIWVFAELFRVSLEGASFPVQHSSPALLPLGHSIQVDAAKCGP